MSILTGLRPKTNEERLFDYKLKICKFGHSKRAFESQQRVVFYDTWAPDGMLWLVPFISTHKPPAGYDPRFRHLFSGKQS